MWLLSLLIIDEVIIIRVIYFDLFGAYPSKGAEFVFLLCCED